LNTHFRVGFDSFSRQQQFRTYVNYVIMPSYELHQEMGLLQYTMSGEKLPEIMPFRNFLSARLLWDEAMASNAIEWTRQNPGGLIVGLVGADHGK
jgi:Haem-binding uptake, Tiki superfamily, ChaN